MPLAHSAYRPLPVVEFLGSRPISAEDAARGLASSVETDEGAAPEARYELPGSTLVNFRQIPGIVDALQTDWVSLPGRERPADCFVEVRGRLETHLHPCFLGEKLALGLRGAAGTLLLRFNKVLQCVPLGFTRLLPAGTHGAIVGESPYVHFLVAFSAVGFVPKQGQWFIGRIAEQQTMQGLNVLILNCFNMFIRRREMPRQLRFDDEKGIWSYEGEDEKAVRLRSKRGPIWVQNRSSVIGSRGPVSLFGTLHWPCFAGEGRGPAVPAEHWRSNGDAGSSALPPTFTAAEVLPSHKEKKEKKEKKDKKEKKEHKEENPWKDGAPMPSGGAADAAPAAAGRPPGPSGGVWTCPSCNASAEGATCRRCLAPRPGAEAVDRGKRRRKGADGSSVDPGSGVRKEASTIGTPKRRRQGAASGSAAGP
uniref:RanBP2-type domain-containing protein n=1 Tax=Alexandrium monilatum TaxID=311494 RepID=A0A6T1JZ30_9DINO